MRTFHDIEAPLREARQFRYQDTHLEIEFADKFAFLDSRRLSLTRKEYQLFTLLVENAGEVVSREKLMMGVWGYSSEIRTRTLDVHIGRLRKQLGGYGLQYIETIFGVGYRFQPFPADERFQTGLPCSEIALTA